MSDEDDVSNADDEGLNNFASSEHILQIGLQSRGFSEKRLAKNSLTRRIEWFQTCFGCPPIVVETMWTDLQTTEIEAARIGGTEEGDIKISIYDFLNALEFLKCYQPERNREGYTGLSSKTLRKRCWYYCGKLQALKEAKIIWPDFPINSIWVMTIAGVHCAIKEPRHPELSQDKDYYSHKKARAGYCYELGISLSSSNLIWLSGPHKAGQNDKVIFNKPEGLKETLHQRGVKAITDKGYMGFKNQKSNLKLQSLRF
jgi:hypothetical protein